MLASPVRPRQGRRSRRSGHTVYCGLPLRLSGDGVPHARGRDEPPPLASSRAEDLRLGEHGIAMPIGYHVIADRFLLADHDERPPQGAHISVRPPRTVPFVESTVDTVVVLSEPQFGDEPWEPDE